MTIDDDRCAETTRGCRRRASPAAWRQLLHNPLGSGRRIIHNAAAPASGRPLRSIMENVANGISAVRPWHLFNPQRIGLPRARPHSYGSIDLARTKVTLLFVTCFSGFTEPV